MTKTTYDKIIEIAQEAIATRGYSAFSFRELAEDLGIKSASIHYHFPTKAHLGVAVAKNYRERLAQALDDIAERCSAPQEALQQLIAIYRHEANTSQRMTVCTMLAAEVKNLPLEIQQELQFFYALNIGWLEREFTKIVGTGGAAREKACQFFALLQGGLMGAKGQASPAYFDVVMKSASLLMKPSIAS